ncbi:hypothetical protein CHI12_14485 [Terribacillus saccharophilus]|uniref:DUF3977 domain-containing protein n=1 Tax=Terribacillus saccharophilus TaxID=361277 RepID=A0A268HAC1_9BACI|nr:DUF3977 family protein [Terribacillus saccharophilus]PAE06809.1 hypothetical protein CHI12_14485 [Terribacillus saccharophilus]
MKYIEIGLGNRWLIRTEFENEDRTEYEKKGIDFPIYLHSFYFRIWINRSVFILDTKDGWKKQRKARKAFKFIIGIVSK